MYIHTYICVQVRWSAGITEDSQPSDGGTIGVEEEIWWPATICKRVKHCDKNGYVWELEYDQLDTPRNDLTRWVYFCSADVLVDFDEREDKNEEVEILKCHFATKFTI